jgi:hypothetical protein
MQQALRDLLADGLARGRTNYLLERMGQMGSSYNFADLLRIVAQATRQRVAAVCAERDCLLLAA